MAQKILGYIQLIWTCDSCGTQNPGAIKACTSCGAPQPTDVQFERVDLEKFNFIKDQALIRMAQSGPDKHCPYCGTRNPSTAEICSACGSDISLGAKSRETGRVLEDVKAPVSPTTSKKLPKKTSLLLLLGLLALCVISIVFLVNLFKTDQITGSVRSVEWQRSVIIDTYQIVSASTWASDIPSDADILACNSRKRYESQTPVENSVEVCGEPYTVDTGTGVGKVVQDCIYEVYEDYCSYEAWAWVPIQTLQANGYDLNPYWPSASLGSTDRLGEQSETYTIYFSVDGSTTEWTTTDAYLFEQARVGSEWELEQNQFGRVTSAQPAN